MNTAQVPVFVIRRRFAAPIAKVYAAWSDPDQMMQWSGPTGSKYAIVEGEVAEGRSTITGVEEGPVKDMFTLSYWRELRPFSRVVWEQSFCDRAGNKRAPPFFDDWPLTLLTEVDLVECEAGTDVTLTWTPIEYTSAALMMFEKQMASMTGGWGGSFDKLDAFLADD